MEEQVCLGEQSMSVARGMDVQFMQSCWGGKRVLGRRKQ